MDPFHHHHHHHRPEPEEYPPPAYNPNPYPPPAYNPYPYQPPPHQPYYDGGGRTDYGPAPPPFQHVSHEYPPPPYVGPAGGYENHHHHHHHHHNRDHWPGLFPPSAENVSHEEAPRHQRTVRVFTKAKEGYSLSIRDGNVVLVPENPRDDYQHWIKDLRYSTRVKDEEGLPSFALVNKVTGQAIKHAVGGTKPVRLVTYNPDYLDESVLWTESKDTGEGFRCIRMVNNIRLNFDAFHGDEDHGGVRDGTTIVLWEWLKGKNQRWKIVPY